LSHLRFQVSWLPHSPVEDDSHSRVEAVDGSHLPEEDDSLPAAVEDGSLPAFQAGSRDSLVRTGDTPAGADDTPDGHTSWQVAEHRSVVRKLAVEACSKAAG
jgi:hypothetical protein